MDCLNSIISSTPVDTICSVLGWQVFCAQARHGIDALPSSLSSRCRAVGTGGAGGAFAPKDSGRSVNPIATRGQIMPTTLLLAMAIRVVEFSNGGYKIRKIFA